MSTAFDKAMAFTFGVEGGLCDVAGDAGKLTKYGISQKAYPGLDIASLTRDDARAIYKRDYWDKVRGDELPQKAALIVFDAAVNSGVFAAGVLIQQTLNELTLGAAGLKVDGNIGPKTIAAARAFDEERLADEMLFERLRFYANLCRVKPDQKQFLLGWLNRVLAAEKAVEA